MNPAEVCRHFGRCGGCSFFEPDYALEAEERRRQIESVLHAGLSRNKRPLLPMARPPRLAPRCFRTRVLYPIRPARDGRLSGGLYAKGSHKIVRIESCLTQDKTLSKLAKMVLGLLRASGMSAYDERTCEGFVRALDLRLAAGSGEALLTLVTKGGLWEGSADFAESIHAQAQSLLRRGRSPFRLVGIVRSLHDEPGNRLLGRRFVPLKGREYLLDRVGRTRHELFFRVSAGSFYQSNRYAEQLLYAPVLELLGPMGGKRVVDAFAGVGCFGLRMARAGAAKVDLIEENPVAARDGAWNIEKNGLGAQVAGHHGTSAAILPVLPKAPDLLLLDPPRAGLGDEALHAVSGLMPKLICYVSCHPKSMARELPRLMAAGYGLDCLRFIDLFPRTVHGEVVAVLRRKA